MGQGEEVRVFIVEDEAIILESYRSILEANGYVVVGWAYNGHNALAELPKSRADIVLMDINMPDMNGLDVLKQLSLVLEVPCVFITGYFDDALIKRANSLGAFGYIIKPIQEQQLLATIRIALRRAQEFSILKQEVSDTKTALENRKVIERAKGILMRRQMLGEEDAMRLLQKKSKDNNTKLISVAKEIIMADQVLGD